MQDKKLILLISLAILALLSLLYGIFTPSCVRRGSSSKAAVSPQELPRSFPTLIPAERISRRSNYPSWGRNPFVAKETQTVTSGKLILDGIAWDEKSPRAAINDRIVTVGDQVGGSTVVEILKDRVILNDGAGNFELRLGRRK